MMNSNFIKIITFFTIGLILTSCNNYPHPQFQGFNFTECGVKSCAIALSFYGINKTTAQLRKETNNYNSYYTYLDVAECLSYNNIPSVVTPVNNFHQSNQRGIFSLTFLSVGYHLILAKHNGTYITVYDPLEFKPRNYSIEDFSDLNKSAYYVSF